MEQKDPSYQTPRLESKYAKKFATRAPPKSLLGELIHAL